MKKFIIFSQKGVFLIFWENRTLIFWEMKLSNLKFKKEHTLKKFLIFWEMEFSSHKLKKLLFFLKKKVSHMFRRELANLENKNFLYLFKIVLHILK